MPGSRAVSCHFGNGGLEHPRGLIFGLAALTPQAYSTWQRTCFMSPPGGSGPSLLPGSELCPLPLCPEPQPHLAGEAGKVVVPTFLTRHRSKRTPQPKVTRSQDQAEQRVTSRAPPARSLVSGRPSLLPLSSPQPPPVLFSVWLQLGETLHVRVGSAGGQAGSGGAREAHSHSPGDSQPLCLPWAALPTAGLRWSHYPSASPYLLRLSLL